MTGSAGQRRVPEHFLAQLTVPVPPICQQRRIAEILDKAEALRARRRAVLAHLDSLRQAIFIDMFGSATATQKGWPRCSLGDVVDLVTGYPFPSEEYVEGPDSVRLCRGANVLPGRIDWSDLARWPATNVADLNEYWLEPGDVIVAMDRPWISEGFKLARMQHDDCPSLLVQRVARLRAKEVASSEFIYQLLMQSVFTSHCRPTETTIPHISPREIRSFLFLLPPKA